MAEVNSLPSDFIIWLQIGAVRFYAIIYFFFNLHGKTLILPVDLCYTSDAFSSLCILLNVGSRQLFSGKHLIVVVG